ncbi:MAG: DUF6600 domain-containing protein [Stellaceae bacterium]
MRSFPWLIALCVVLALTAAPASAGEPLPSRVGRISLAEAGAGWRPAGGDWSDATVNAPVAAGASLRTTGDGRAEIRLGGGVVALAPGSAIDIVRYDSKTLEVALTRGRIGLRLGRRAPQSAVVVDTSRGSVRLAVRLAVPGQYDIDAGGAEVASRVTVFAGKAQITGDGIAATILAGHQALASATVVTAATAAPDAFAEWWRGDTGGTATIDHFAPALTGAAALSANGSWQNTSRFGAVWMPKSLPASWVPFRDGNWRFIAPWGWTWIDRAAWGFATSHYGRWVRVDHHWGWVPPGDPAPGYAPAVVAFLGTPGIGLSYAGGSGPAVAWFPLGPGEPYWAPDAGEPPAAVIDGTYRYRRFATAVPRPVFVAGKPVADALVDIPQRRLAVAPLVAGGPQIPPPTPHTPATPHPAAVAVTHKPAAPVHLATKVHLVATIHSAIVHRAAAHRAITHRAVAHRASVRGTMAHLAAEHRPAKTPARRPPATLAARHRRDKTRLAAHRPAKSAHRVHLAAGPPHAARVTHSRRQHLAAARHILRQ